MESSDSDDALSDEPRLSSAALCIEMSHMGSSFRPEFTHQCVPGEFFRGCRPRRHVLLDAIERTKRAGGSGEPSTPGNAGSSGERSEDEESPRRRGKAKCGPPSLASEASAPRSKRGRPKKDSGGSSSVPPLSPSSISSTSKKIDADALLHSSHLHHSQANKELGVKVTLAPSCRTCHVHVDMSPDRSNKRRRKSKSGDSSKEVRGAPKVKFAQISSDENEGDNEENQKELTESDILGMLQQALPLVSDDVEDVKKDYMTKHVGKIVAEYAVERPQPRKDDSPGRTRSKTTERFVISLADGSDPIAGSYHNAVQSLAMLFIETGDDVDISATNSGYWKVLYLFHKMPSGTSSNDFHYSLAGYITLYHFYAIFHKPTPGIIVRICQALILPPYQRQGHGRRLLQCVYDIAHDRVPRRGGKNAPKRLEETIVEVNVEDPAPAFVALRCKVDYNMFAEQLIDWLEALDENDITIEDESFFISPTESQLAQLGALTKTTPRQMQIVCELVKLKVLRLYEARTADSPTRGLRYSVQQLENVQKRFRLMVKRRLNKEHRECLSALSSKEEKQSYLAERFDEDLALYEKILKNEEK